MLSSFISFFNILKFLPCKCFTYLVKVTPRSFALFEAFVKCYSLMSFSGRVSFVCRRAADFCELILYAATLLKVFISHRAFLVDFWGSLKYIIFSVSRYTFITISSFPVCIPLGILQLSIALAKTPSPILNRYV